MTIRAKFQCQEENRSYWRGPDSRVIKFAAVYDPELPEDQRFCKATPTGTLEMTVDNPSAQFTLGAFYYLDFTPVPEQPTPAADIAAQGA